ENTGVNVQIGIGNSHQCIGHSCGRRRRDTASRIVKRQLTSTTKWCVLFCTAYQIKQIKTILNSNVTLTILSEYRYECGAALGRQTVTMTLESYNHTIIESFGNLCNSASTSFGSLFIGLIGAIVVPYFAKYQH
ncbi:unnamed protein product, partial [Didymodactylos carnosus]